MALFFNKMVLENDQIIDKFSNNKILLNKKLIREMEEGTIDPYLHNIDLAAMRIYLLTLIRLSSFKGIVMTNSEELLIVLYGNSTFSDRNVYKFFNGNIYKLYLKVMHDLIKEEYITIIDGEFNPDKIKENFILEINKDKTYLNFEKGDKGTTINLKEFQSIMTIKDISPAKKLKLLYTFLYIKSFAYAYKLSDHTVVYAKCIYDKIKTELGISLPTIRSYISILSEETAPIIKCRMRPFVISDYKCDDKFFSSPNLFMFRYDSYYKGMEEDVKSIETKRMDDYLKLMRSERRKKNA